MIEIKICPSCNSENFSSYQTCVDYTVSHETFQLIKCETCNLVITTPRPENHQLSKYYKSDNYISHTNKASTIIDQIYLLARKYTLRKKINILRNLKKKGTILDYGCGTGEFLNACKSNGWIISGLEPSPDARAKANHLNQILIHESLDEIQKKYDTITLWHVLEHVADLNDTLKKLSSLLKENGIIFIAVPNYESYDAHYYKQNWAAFDVPRHLWHFDKNSMETLLIKNCLTIESIVPMKLDSFYVSLLSEKYKNNKQTLTGMAKAFYIGLKSNLKAKQSNNFSSLIYIARK